MATTPSTGGAGLPIRVRRYAELTPSLRGFIDAAERTGSRWSRTSTAPIRAASAATAPMGGPRNPWAVVDSRGAVKGIDGLRVVDASIMPGVPSVAVNPTVLMIAGRIAKEVYAAEPGARQVQVA
jgi:choline dehydrogenase-like flavoprotein